MATSRCARLAVGSCVYGFPNASIHVRDTFSLSFCTSKLIHHFFCDAPAVMTLSCSDRHTSELLLIVVASLNILFCPPSYLDFLPVHMCHHPEDALGLGIPEGFIHLPVSPHHSLHLLWDRHLHILPAQLQSFHPLRKNGVRVLYGSHPRAESCGLQPKKQSQECFQESY